MSFDATGSFKYNDYAVVRKFLDNQNDLSFPRKRESRNNTI